MQLLLLWDKLDHLRGMMTHIIQLLEAGKIKPYVGKVFDFENVFEAHKFLESRKSKGKLLLKTKYAEI